MRVQILVAPAEAYPDAKGSKKKISIDPPYGAMYIASALREDGHSVKIETCDIDYLSNAELARRIRQFNPDIIGLGATVASSYKYVKDISRFIKKEFPDVKIMLGGGLTAAPEAVLNNTDVDIVVIGEGDLTVKEVVSKINRKEDYHSINGVAFKEGPRTVITPPRAAIINLDTLPYPAMDLVDMRRYFINIRWYADMFRYYNDPDRRLFAPGRSRDMLRIIISRGCIGRCSFCYRPVPGLRLPSLDHIFDYLEHLVDAFKINIFSFGDECFAPNKAWNLKFAEGLRRRKLDIMFQVLGMRVDTVDYEVLRALKEAGCFMILYGFESGSQKMLDIMDKRVTVEDNIKATDWTRKAGIFTTPNFIFGMPGEDTRTIEESIDFLKKIGYGAHWYQYAYPMAVPGTPLYDYAKSTSLIRDDDKYLEGLYLVNVHNLIDAPSFINYTSEDFAAVKDWPALVENSLIEHYSKNIFAYFAKKYLRLEGLAHSFKMYGIIKTLSEICRRIFHRRDRHSPNIAGLVKDSPERKRYMIIVRDIIGANVDGLNLRQITEKIKENNEYARAAQHAHTRKIC